MTKTIAIFGAGTGLGVSVARRFGREGYRVALVARRRAPLDTLVQRLAAENIEAAAFTADLARTAEIPALVDAIKQRFGRIDVIEYAPIAGVTFVPAADLDPETLQRWVDLYLLTPVELIRSVLPDMLKRGDGGILVGHGYSAVQPAPFMGGLGPVMAAMRNYLYSLNGEIAGHGVYAGTLTVTAMITGSEGHRALISGERDLGLPDGIEVPVVDPEDLADRLWNLFVTRDRTEAVHPPIAA